MIKQQIKKNRWEGNKSNTALKKKVKRWGRQFHCIFW